MPQNNNIFNNNPNLPSQGASYNFTPEMGREYKKCFNQIDYFAENYFYITTLDEGKRCIDLYPAQKKVLKASALYNRMVLVSSRQAGKTTILTIFALWHTCFWGDKRVLIVANKEDTAIEILRRIRMAYEQLPNWLKPGVKQWGKTEVVFENDSSIIISSTSSSAARGQSINILMIDEAAHIQEHIIDEFWKSVIPVISSSKHTKIFAVSTPNGTNNKFHELYTGAERGENGWHMEKINWHEIPGRGKKWKKMMLADVGSEEAFEQEFNCSFIEKGETAIGGGAIETFRSTSLDPKFIMDDGHYKIWEEPIPGHIYTIGVDVCEGVGEAASVCQVLDITNLQDIRQAATYHNEKLDPYHFSAEVFKLCNQWGRPWISVERNNCGGQVIDCLTKTHHYEKLISYNPETRKKFNMLGVYSHTNAKYTGVTNMRYWMNSLRCVEVRDIALVHELETFVRHNNNTWKKANGKHNKDDRVMALVWALFILHEEVAPGYYNILDWDDNGKPLKLEEENVEGPEFYRLDSFYLQDNAPLPAHFMDNGSGDEETADLLQQGWSFF